MSSSVKNRREKWGQQSIQSNHIVHTKEFWALNHANVCIHQFTTLSLSASSPLFDWIKVLWKSCSPQEKWRQMYVWARRAHICQQPWWADIRYLNNWKGFVQWNFYNKCVCRVSFTGIKPLVFVSENCVNTFQ